MSGKIPGDASDEEHFESTITTAKSKLTQLFTKKRDAKPASSSEAGSPPSLIYRAPKQPVHEAPETLQQPPPSLANQGHPSGMTSSSQSETKIVFAAAVHLFALQTGQYVSRGRVGLALIGAAQKKMFQLLLYVEKTKPIVQLPITTQQPFTVSENGYIGLRDGFNRSWSIAFSTSKDLERFLLHVTAVLHILGEDRVTFDLNPGEGGIITLQDAVEIEFSEFEVGSDLSLCEKADQQILKFRIAKKEAKFPHVWVENLTSMRKGGKRIFLVPAPGFSATSIDQPEIFSEPIAGPMIVSVTIKRTKKRKEESLKSSNSRPESPEMSVAMSEAEEREAETPKIKDTNVPGSPTPTKKAEAHLPTDHDTLLSRMARIGHPMFGPTPADEVRGQPPPDGAKSHVPEGRGETVDHHEILPDLQMDSDFSFYDDRKPSDEISTQKEPSKTATLTPSQPNLATAQMPLPGAIPDPHMGHAVPYTTRMGDVTGGTQGQSSQSHLGSQGFVPGQGQVLSYMNPYMIDPRSAFGHSGQFYPPPPHLYYPPAFYPQPEKSVANTESSKNSEILNSLDRIEKLLLGKDMQSSANVDLITKAEDLLKRVTELDEKVSKSVTTSSKSEVVGDMKVLSQLLSIDSGVKSLEHNLLRLQDLYSSLEQRIPQKTNESEVQTTAQMVKKIMNSLYKDLERQFPSDQHFSSDEIKLTLASTIREVTNSVLNSQNLGVRETAVVESENPAENQKVCTGNLVSNANPEIPVNNEASAAESRIDGNSEVDRNCDHNSVEEEFVN